MKGRDNWLERRRNDLENNFFLNLRCLKYFLASLILVPEITSTVFKDIEIPPGECAIHNALDATMKNFGIYAEANPEVRGLFDTQVSFTTM